MIFSLSCSKLEPVKQADEPQNLNAYEMKVNEIIKDFREKAINCQVKPGYKSGGSIEADSALWLMEATINYSHAFPNDFYEEMQTGEFTVTVPKNSNGEVNLDDLLQKYNEMKGDITTAYYNSTYQDKGLVLVDLTETSQTTSEITMNVEMVTG
ncbi:MAG: hypothetical protein K8R53_11010, partial [Bacteroidales bacterium]|nr:hypothetical protein [Bacteroidales bacterium]